MTKKLIFTLLFLFWWHRWGKWWFLDNVIAPINFYRVIHNIGHESLNERLISLAEEGNDVLESNYS